MKKVLIFFSLTFSYGVCFSQPSPYGTGFAYGSKEDLEIRLAWAKKDPCFNPGFSKESREYSELRKYQMIQAGPNGKPPVCQNKTR